MNHNPNNRKVASNRGLKWRQALAKGKLNALMKPSKIRHLRVSENKTQKALAKSLDLSASTFMAIEQGKRAVTPERADKIAKYFKTKVKNLFKEKDGILLAL